ncbi:hypothetical protein EYF80_048243 [Liparis tanakae]|uniref:Uncharacterized protein n=1 Tax=Liparis tanakae TaxID=230148 RepID=A0A4Z2FL28_9TELE|nr:hypothetical protein EYF80_048243 [Liparis tanakae]
MYSTDWAGGESTGVRLRLRDMIGNIRPFSPTLRYVAGLRLADFGRVLLMWSRSAILELGTFPVGAPVKRQAM